MNRVRSTHFHAEDRYVINRNKAQYKTDPSGHFKASYTYRNETDQADHIHISVIFEEYAEPVQTLQLTVPPRSSKSTYINLKDIPSGRSRIVYIIAQTSLFDLKTEQDDWNTEYAAVYYFELISCTASSGQLERPPFVQPVHQKRSSGEQVRLIYLSDRKGHRVRRLDDQHMYISLINEETYKLKGCLYHFQNGNWQSFQINQDSARAFSYELEPESVQTYRISLSQNGYSRFFATAVIPADALQDVPFTPRMVSPSELYIIPSKHCT
ncbi:hypothetical protein ACSYGW_02235 [Bacillus glycinifermentans]|uniref:hypothetical protein n=1 Tax=Bacillus glycinifermentans TaxID=1664069 RepID=UPI00069FB85E|nr:hypothetical protein [Bacillus glycinifermentans]MEC0496777.1 hypothetical protein [Bacillus glycinifermentans]MEC0539717.1 hypothetical protein [Bacillus glycinifermentans]